MPESTRQPSKRASTPPRSTSTPDAAAPAPALTPALERDAARLESALRELTRVYAKLNEAGERRRAAVRAANHRALQEAIADEAGAAGMASRADRDRADAARAILQTIGAPASGEATASWIASRLPDPLRPRIEDAAGALRATLERGREHHAADRLAAETIAAHLQGVLHAAASAAGGSVTYGSRGAMETRREQVASVMDLTT